MSLVEVKNLYRSFGKVHAVQDLSFQFDAGEIFGFIGPNGAGKSTTMRILATLDIPSSGDCLIDGKSTVDYADTVRGLIGYMPDSYGSYPNMTVLEYIDFFARAYQLRGEARKRAVFDTVDFCQLGDLSDKPITTLSKGMKQRLCLGRCLVHDPNVLILDEPSAGLDPRARIEFRDLLKILAEQGKAVFISSHILAELEELCDSVAIIELGKLISTGNIRSIKKDLRNKALAQQDKQEELEHNHVIEIHLYTEWEESERCLAEQPMVTQAHVDGTSLLVTCSGNAETQHQLLVRLIQAGMPLYSFAGRDHNLEDVFLQLTEGLVQ